jgi:hypothetical protein
MSRWQFFVLLKDSCIKRLGNDPPEGKENMYGGFRRHGGNIPSKASEMAAQEFGMIS